ncbi:hypothetical protein HanPI659440_Chr03g0123601 [Helianthus annuus]|nr:hypothetical protein HanPI659440_Chr03g0123601 [Helianthus annuus]
MEEIEETEMCIICVRRHSVDLTRISMLFSRSVCCNLPDKLLQVGITRQLQARSTFRSSYS